MSRIPRFVEWIALGTGVLLLAVYFVARWDGRVQTEAALEEFAADKQTMRPQPAAPEPDWEPSPELYQLDTTLWAEGRIAAYEESLEADLGRTLAVLRIPKIRLEVPVLEGTDEITLNRGIGRIVGTAKPGAEGNLGLAGHRDGFFRGLKDVELGDELHVETLDGTLSYRIDKISIVEPEDVYVLDPTPEPAVTLVTCYPFYFVGSAPQRYIVRASLSGPA